jgi:hypothetical protein
MTKFDKSKKIRLSGFLFRTIRFWQFQNRNMTGAETRRFKDPRYFEVWKGIKKYQGAKMEEIQAISRDRKNSLSSIKVYNLVCLGKIFSYMTQRVSSSFIYKDRSQPIVTHHQTIDQIYSSSYFLP